ncbi:hypothetical protein GCM10009430_27580 [Aquimarina litoralis]|uniref:Por secretion system C-terminal sorting domain-containing protein n=1 Tax=Aquimarina litoralis TaxID=584605 RepID=A0ABN1IY38_9FLAO
MRKNIITTITLLLLTYFSNAQQTPDQIAREWISKNKSNLKTNSDENLMLKASRKGLSGHTMRYQQTINGIPVFDTELTIHVSNKNQVTHVEDNSNENIVKINTAPAVLKTSALDIAKRHIKADGYFSREESKLYVYNKTGTTKLVYVNKIRATTPIGYWQVIVDATTGEIIESKNIDIEHNFKIRNKERRKSTALKKNTQKPKTVSKKLIHEFENEAIAMKVDGTGMVFDPDPLSVSGQTYGGNFSDNNDATNAELDAARSSVVLRDITFANGVYRLQGPYVEIVDIQGPSKGLFTQATSDFNFNRSDDAFEAVNCYYHLDKSLRYINETLGINLVSLFNNGVLEYDPSSFNGADNSSYGGGQLNFGEGGVDDAEDADVILHELGHGLHDWLTNGSLSQVNGLSEGCGDYWAQSYKRSLGQWQSSEASYHFVFGWDGNNEFWPGRSTNYNANFPGDLSGSIHRDGQIWATSLMRIYDIIGREKTDKAFLEGLAMTNSATNQENAAIAVRQAAIDMGYDCSDVNVFTTEFTNTGYNMPAINLVVNCPGDQTVSVNSGNSNYIVEDFTSMANAINTGCNATITQDPAIGSTLPQGVHTITLTATGTTSASCTFNLTVDNVLGTDDFIEQSKIVLYPIPANENIILQGDFDTKETLIIHNLVGQKIMTVSISQKVTNINIAQLPKGVYFGSFEGKKGNLKFIKN